MYIFINNICCIFFKKTFLYVLGFAAISFGTFAGLALTSEIDENNNEITEQGKGSNFQSMLIFLS